MVTSSAVVGSSAISNCGRFDDGHGDHYALAHAAGKLVRIVAGAAIRVGDGDICHGLNGEFRTASRLEFLPWASTASAIWSPTRITGLRAVIGSWKIMAMREPRSWRMESSGNAGRLRVAPFSENKISPEICAWGGRRRMMAREVMDLPEPDSPTNPKLRRARWRSRDRGRRE